MLSIWLKFKWSLTIIVFKGQFVHSSSLLNCMIYRCSVIDTCILFIFWYGLSNFWSCWRALEERVLSDPKYIFFPVFCKHFSFNPIMCVCWTPYPTFSDNRHDDFQEKGEKKGEIDIFKNFHYVYCDLEVVLRHICQDVSAV